MAGKANFKIANPKNVKVIVKGSGGQAMSQLQWKSNFGSTYLGKFSRKQAFVDSECIRRMAPETPFRTGTLAKAAVLGTVLGSGIIHQETPYARRQYYEHKTKSKWFERMKNRHKDSILRGAKAIE